MGRCARIKSGSGKKGRNVLILTVIASSGSDVAILKYEIATAPSVLRNDTARTFSPHPRLDGKIITDILKKFMVICLFIDLCSLLSSDYVMRLKSPDKGNIRLH